MDQADKVNRASVVIAECMRRVDAGETVDAQDVLAEYPELADELRDYFAAERMVGSLLGAPQDVSPQQDQPRSSRETAVPGKADSVPTSGRSFDKLPAEFGRYRLQRVLGQGAMGAVYLAHDTKLARDVALKTPKLDVLEGSELVERFDREARSAATLHHRNICPVFDVGEIDGVRFLTMAYIEGRPLSSYVSEEKPMSRRQAAVVIRKLALALQEAHDHGIVHRDLKPANVMIDKAKEPVVMDFGLARRLEHTDRSRLTGVGVLMGSPAYMSPEQVGSDPDIGPPSDIYSLGVILYELLSGRLPYEGSVVAIIGQIVSADPPDIRTLRPVVDDGLATICATMMAKATQDRYASMKDVADALGDYLRDFRKNPAANTGTPSAERSIVASDLVFDDAVGNAPSSKTTRPEPKVSRRKSERGTKGMARWIGGGLLAMVILAGVIIKFRDGTTVEIADGTTATIATNEDGSLQSLTVTSANSDQTSPESSGNLADSESATNDDGFVELFNGVDLTGWRVEGGPGWTVENGEIVGRAQRSRLVTVDEDYGDCEIRVECRLGADVNSGIYARNRFGDGHFTGFEAQLSNQQKQDTLTGGIYGHTVIKERLIPDDQWFELRFILTGRQLEVVVNGKVTSKSVVPADSPSQGAISLQSMNGGPVRFRKVAVRRLPQNTVASDLTTKANTFEMLPTGQWVSLLETEAQLQDWRMLNGTPTVVNGTVSLQSGTKRGNRLYGKRLTRPISTNAKRFVFHVRHNKVTGFGMGEGLNFGASHIGVTNFEHVFELWAGRDDTQLVAKHESRQGTGGFADCDYVVIDNEFHAFLNGKRMYTRRAPQGALTEVTLSVRKATALWREVAMMKLSDAQVEAFRRGELPKYSADQAIPAPKSIRHSASETPVKSDSSGRDFTNLTVQTGVDASQLAVSPNESRAVTTGADSPGRFTVWNIDSGDQIAQFDDPERPGHATTHLSYSPDGQSLLYCTGNQVRVVSAADGTAQATFDFPAPPTLVVFPQSTWALAVYHERDVHRTQRADVVQRLRIWDWKNDDVLYDEAAPQQPSGFPSISPDERFVTLDQEHHHIRYTLVIDGDTVALSTPTDFEQTSRVRGPLVFSPDGKHAATSVKSNEYMAAVLDVQTGRIVTRLDPATAEASNEHHQYGCSLGFTPDGTQIVMADHTGRSALWDIATGKLIEELEQFRKEGNHATPGVAVSPDGHVVLGGRSADRRITVKRLQAAPSAIAEPRQQVPVEQTTDVADDNWTDLFNGRDLTGWHEVYSTGAWSVRGGELVARNQEGKETLGLLATDAAFLNFELELEYHIERGGNSGVFLRSITDPSTVPRVIGADQLEIQILDDDGPKHQKLRNEQRNGAVYGVIGARPRTIAPAQEWNRMHIKAVGSKIIVIVNDVRVVDADLDNFQDKILGKFQYKQPGQIGLQWYGNPVWFRNVRIRKLDADG